MALMQADHLNTHNKYIHTLNHCSTDARFLMLKNIEQFKMTVEIF